MQLKPIPVLNILLSLTVVIFGSGFLIQLWFPFFIHWKLRRHKTRAGDVQGHPPVSVIICARNEQENLLNNLPLVLEQEYPDFEVIVVNDCSFDESEQVLKDFSLRYSQLRIVTINEHQRYKHGKKFAVTLGIKKAGNELLVFTDADCYPSSRQWLAKMAANFSGEKEIVLGYSPYEKLPGFLNNVIRFETFYTAVNYLSFALCGDPYMGVGRNLAYKKELFFKGKGFASHMHIPSGDDDLFVNQNATAENTAIEIHSDAQVISHPKTNYSSYKNQKLRHYGAGTAYRTRHKRLLILQVASGLLFYISAALLFTLKSEWWPFTLTLLFLRTAVQFIVYVPVFKKLKCTDLIIWLPVLDIFYYFYLTFFNIATLFKKKVQWR